MENSHCFVNPKPENGQFRITVEFVENVNTLDDLADISHVEDVMRLGRSGQECISNRVVKTDGCHCQCFGYLLYLIIEILGKEFVRQNVVENSPHLRL